MTAAQEWFLEGKQEGRTEGREEGREEGERAALASMITKQVRLRFRDLPPESAARIESASKADLERWLERFVIAESLEDLFA